jgi:hypothetical protein
MNHATLDAPSLFNSQQFLFGKTSPTAKARTRIVPNDYYDYGWTIIDNVADAEEALTIQQSFIGSIDARKAPLHARFRSRIQLAKADQIPVCDDIVATNFQILHFDMGQPFVESDDQLLITHVGIYLPSNTAHAVTAKTRLVELDGLLENAGLTTAEIEERLMRYVNRHGDGWTGHNSLRLACFARFLDALSDEQELEADIDKTVGQWFQNETKLDAGSAHEQESAFYAHRGVDLKKVEQQIALKPGQLLILDNARVIHGRIGNRKAKELYNFMFGIEAIDREDITALRRSICSTVR